MKILRLNPFKEHKLQRQKTDRGFLTQKEIEALMNEQFEEPQLEQTRDVFIFCMFTGLSHTDVKHLKTKNISSSFDGKQWIIGKRKKTNTNYNIPLLNILLNRIICPIFNKMQPETFRKGIDAYTLYTRQITAELLDPQIAVAEENAVFCPKCKAANVPNVPGVHLFPKVAKCPDTNCGLSLRKRRRKNKQNK